MKLCAFRHLPGRGALLGHQVHQVAVVARHAKDDQIAYEGEKLAREMEHVGALGGERVHRP